ncbi:MAG: energy-coupling factor transporter ATPase [Candidatus Enterosoma sp.]|nr:energy-coupling factor transporter ATPase [bacterium]MDY2571483.1 energy-coupling factor transporter ATPase [Candidatus Enterosoma sp.]MDY3080795.1 energy-coupling factor transporter ATPase [Candidatus Enterosoma sp.]MDY3265231.1 energy-coupling factor transporter ATPase [Candidatus Enterosoma sp.]MDY3726440.1 energy-coupling factor transporter ATPase [Candidatus Enterosoma sp.]
MRSESKRQELLKRDENIAEDSAIFLKDLSFSYIENGPLNIKEITLDIKRGQSVAIIGHNGSGKSTLAKLIDGILVQKSGDIFIFGVKMTDDNVLLLRRDIALVFQNPDSQFIGATVRDDIAFGLENECVDPKAMPQMIEECAKKVGMEEYLDREPCNLSGGQKQRVAIAGAIARKSSILILDEASAMLDPKGKSELRALIKKTREENPDLTVLNITHELEDASVADRVIVLNAGKVVLDGTPFEVFSHVEELKGMRLDIPFVQKLKQSLSVRGISLSEINSDEDLLNALCQ